ncbi:MAG: hypothetical protein IKS60_04350 [Lachnospiraceae bacterium]|nr:hypothetical protein [Lachnospiraceae bacterium]MBR4412822.1 hypothetical protein [Lachnospiraceae bacterium]MBR5066837.1 hypothetical protein [Lachnospiraceae bacterium]MBR5916900.1 hypothetical protein [Lachnospiraceae bacterium]
MRIKKYALGFFVALGIMCMCACTSKTNKYDEYHKEVNKLYEKIVTAGAIIDTIDTNKEGYEQELYDSLDDLQDAFDEFSKVDPPKEFKDCKMLSEKASSYVANSSKCFHLALDEKYNEEMFNAGVSNYNEAIKCINYMGDVLQKK